MLQFFLGGGAGLVATIVQGATGVLAIGSTTELTATTSGGAGTVTVAWSSSDDAIATVDATGLVTGIGAGSVTITATPSDDNGAGTPDSISITVSAAVRYYYAVVRKNVDGQSVAYVYADVPA